MKKLIIIFLFLTTSLFVKAQFGSENYIYNSIKEVYDTKIADIDGDGYDDVIVADFEKILYHKNDGFGNFEIGITLVAPSELGYVSPNGIRSIEIIDLNGDGDQDLITGTIYTDSILMFDNDGEGNFSFNQVLTSSSSCTRSLFIADINNDGKTDILSASSCDDKLAWYENLGNGNFSSQKIISNSASYAFDIHVSDLDNDGNLDVIAALGGSRKVVWYKNLGNEAFGIQQLVYTENNNLYSVNSADVDNDGDMDILSSSFVTKIAWYSNLGNGTFGSKQILENNCCADNYLLETKDLNSDGLIDFAATSYDNLSITMNLGGGVFSTQIINSAGATSLSFGDLNQDAKPDLIFGNASGLTLSKNDGLGNFNVFEVLNTLISPNIFPIDFDNDNDLDILAVADGKNIVWFENLDNNKFEKPELLYGFTSNFDIVALSAGDYDNDGNVDVIFSSGVPKLLKNNGNNQFTLLNPFSQLFDYYRTNVIHSADLDFDGDLDLVTEFSGENDYTLTFKIFENIGNDTFSEVIIPMANFCAGPHEHLNNIASADIGNDGDLDIMISSSSCNKIKISTNVGGMSFVNGANYTTISNTYSELGDLDNNGDFDVITSSSLGNSISTNINGTWNTVSSNASKVSSVVPFDAENDGDIDILASIKEDNEVSFFTNDSLGNFSSRNVISNKALNADKAIAKDIDGDGDLDVIWVTSDGLLAWHENFSESKYQLNGYTFFDGDENGIKDSSELGLGFHNLSLTPQNQFQFSSNDGKFNFNTTAGIHTINYNQDSLWYLTSDSTSYTRTLSDTIPIIDSLNYGFFPDTMLTVINPVLTGAFPTCNDSINYWINIRNTGTTTPHGIFSLELDSSITFLSSSIMPDSIVGQSLYWHYDTLFYFTEKLINLQIVLPPFTSMGDTLSSHLTVFELDSLNNIVYSNSDTLKQILVCAYDPNDKAVTPKGLGSEGFIAKDINLEYLIRFQNTGTDTATSIMVRDQLDYNLDWNSLYPLGSSHPVQIWLEQDGEVVFKFDNINLPDSGANFSGSQGFVKFTINLKPNLDAGTQIYNTSEIYFDHNPAVITNTTLNTIFDCSMPNVSLSVNSINFCETDTLISLINDSQIFNNHIWSIDNFLTYSDTVFKWPADTSGIFNLKLRISNAICSKDTNVNFVVFPIYQVFQNSFICPGDSILIYGSYKNSAGIYYDSLQTINGCDSILSTSLILNPFYSFYQNTSICPGDSILIYGSYQKSAGIYYDSLQTINGCDSILVTDLQLKQLPIVDAPDLDPDTICNNQQTVLLPFAYPQGGIYYGVGVNDGYFDPSIAGIGTHNVIYEFVGSNTCTNRDTTSITVQLCLGLQAANSDYGVLIYPNPSTKIVTIEKPNGLNREIQLKLVDVTSKVLIDKKLPIGLQKIDIDITNYEKGIYYLQLIIDKEIFVTEILKN